MGDAMKKDAAMSAVAEKIDELIEVLQAAKTVLAGDAEPEFPGIAKGNGDENKRAKPRRRVPPDWQPTAAGIEFARARGLDVTTELEQFRSHHISKGTLFADIDAGWRKWCGLAVKFAAKRRGNGSSHKGIIAGTLEDLAALEGPI